MLYGSKSCDLCTKFCTRRGVAGAILQNTNNALSYLQVQDSSLQTVGKVVDRMAELRVMAQDVTKNTSDIENYSKEFVGPSCIGALVPMPWPSSLSQSSAKLDTSDSPCCATPVTSGVTSEASEVSHHQEAEDTSLSGQQPQSDEGFIDETDCDCDTRNFSEDGETRVPVQYCFSCAPFHPSNGRGPTLVGPNQQQVTNPCPLIPQEKEQEDKLIYDMDSKSTRNQVGPSGKRKRHISIEETQDAIISILPKKKKEEEEEGDDLNDSGFQEENEVHFFLNFLSLNFVQLSIKNHEKNHNLLVTNI